MSALKDNLAAVKEQIAKHEETKKQQSAEYDAAMKELRKYDGEFRALREK